MRASSALIPSGRSLVSKMKSNSMATISIVIDSIWFAFWPSGDSCRSRSTLCMPCGMPEKATVAPPTSKSVWPACSSRQALMQVLRGNDRRARHVAGRRGRHRRKRVAAWRLDLREVPALRRHRCAHCGPIWLAIAAPSTEPKVSAMPCGDACGADDGVALPYMRLNIAITSTSGGGALALALAASARACIAVGGAAAIDDRRAHRGRNDLELGEVLIQFRIDDADVAHRRLVQFLQDLELDAPVGLDGLQRLGKRFDDRRGRKGIGVRAEIRSAQQEAQAAVQRQQFVVGEVLDDPRDVARRGPIRPSTRFRPA